MTASFEAGTSETFEKGSLSEYLPGIYVTGQWLHRQSASSPSNVGRGFYSERYLWYGKLLPHQASNVHPARKQYMLLNLLERRLTSRCHEIGLVPGQTYGA